MSGDAAIRLSVTGRVQGVGFRPAVYRLAADLGLSGSVRNTGRAVVIEVQGPADKLAAFRARLSDVVPGLAHVDSIEAEPIPASLPAGFRILESESTPSDGRARIPADLATCPDCLREMFDPEDRRHRYPFINCTRCGPRYTIIESLPYDRARTSMKAFPLCQSCRAEYQDPGDRRFHAEPVACAECGPRLSWCDARGNPLAGDPLAGSIALLREGRILALKGLGGFHLSVDAGREEAVAELRRRKRRGRKPLALMVAGLDDARRVARVSAPEAALLESAARPIVLLEALPGSPLAPLLAPGLGRLGIMLPYTPLHHLLCREFPALVMTSGNLSEEPIACDNREALDRLANLCDAFLLHDREIRVACDDSVSFLAAGGPALVRRSRGYAPEPVPLPGAPDGLLAVGAQMKNTFCLTRDGQAYLSQHIGDLDNPVTFEHFRRSLSQLSRITGITPRRVACDLHPDYGSTRLAQELGLPLLQVQHHHAHLAAALADAGVEGDAIGLCLDGTGLGDDGTIWGGEVLVGSAARYRRAARLLPFGLPGGDAAVREPWRTAVGLLLAAGGPDRARAARALFDVEERLFQGVLTAAARGVNTPVCSSAGRLFDGVSALLGICPRAEYDGQAAAELEAAAGADEGPPWEMPLRENGSLLDLDWRPLLDGLLCERARGVPVPALSARFHESLSRGLVACCREIRRRGGPARVALSGGCFMNRRLQSRLEGELQQEEFSVIVHRRVPANDGGLCLGQAAVAAARKER
ncbi:MAG: carbamoyltransferase HypF [Myxococcales bacterium]|nr:carbamoyltransferase HypF [Myxococcales bacterium]